MASFVQTAGSACAQDTYAGMSLDEALRKLVREFKLPGEAQQIDRIMEKFAEAFCRHNPGTFRAAEDAYRLAFAVIMLNTDVHNPLAEHMLTRGTFVDMNSDQGAGGEAVPALPVAALHAIYDRVCAQVRRPRRHGGLVRPPRGPTVPNATMCPPKPPSYQRVSSSGRTTRALAGAADGCALRGRRRGGGGAARATPPS